MTNHYEAILVLGCGIESDGTLTDDARSSAQIAADLIQQEVAPLVIFSGTYSYKAEFVPPIGEGQAMKDYAVSLGVLATKILVEDESKDTLGNIYFSKVNLLAPMGLNHIAIVRGPNHSLERLNYIFKKVLGSEYEYDFIERPENRPEEQRRERESLVALKRLLEGVQDGDDAAVYKAMRERHPGYMTNPKV